jgi:hypothetical protein
MPSLAPLAYLDKLSVRSAIQYRRATVVYNADRSFSFKRVNSFVKVYNARQGERFCDNRATILPIAFSFAKH